LTVWHVVVVAVSVAIALGPSLAGQQQVDGQAAPPPRDSPLGAPGHAAAMLATAQGMFYNGRYEAASAQALELRTLDPSYLAAYELRASALLFDIKGTLGDIKASLGDERDRDNRDAAFRACVRCPDLLAAYDAEIAEGLALARTALAAAPADEDALFLLGKLNLNHVWLHLGTLGRRTGWNQYWEARRSLDTVLRRNPEHVRARVARAWIDYIVDTRMPRGTRWVLGGGNKKKALVALRTAAEADAEFFIHAEAEFALWDIHIREKNMAEAAVVARRLARDFPDNVEVARFLSVHDAATQP
jgi:hypothetical protein